MFPALPLLLIAFLLIPFIPVGIRVVQGKKTSVEIEIQPFCIVLKSNDKKSGKKKKENKTKEILNLVRLALPYAELTVSHLDVSVFSRELYSLYTNTAFLGAALYPLLSYVGLRSKKLTVNKGAPECTPAGQEQNSTELFLDVTIDLRLYSVILVLAKHFLLKKRRGARARRNKGFD